MWSLLLSRPQHHVGIRRLTNPVDAGFLELGRGGRLERCALSHTHTQPSPLPSFLGGLRRIRVTAESEEQRMFQMPLRFARRPLRHPIGSITSRHRAVSSEQADDTTPRLPILDREAHTHTHTHHRMSKKQALGVRRPEGGSEWTHTHTRTHAHTHIHTRAHLIAKPQLSGDSNGTSATVTQPMKQPTETPHRCKGQHMVGFNRHLNPGRQFTIMKKKKRKRKKREKRARTTRQP
ncbi:hypothetical protein LY78DRAFT_107898 [Colletotrichum sublineola]|nr:hypothetical protein LY78DRAFT_107898 [Colletotrichum sublineola]